MGELVFVEIHWSSSLPTMKHENINTFMRCLASRNRSPASCNRHTWEHGPQFWARGSGYLSRYVEATPYLRNHRYINTFMHCLANRSQSPVPCNRHIYKHGLQFWARGSGYLSICWGGPLPIRNCRYVNTIMNCSASQNWSLVPCNRHIYEHGLQVWAGGSQYILRYVEAIH
jgi:hypothetical protein